MKAIKYTILFILLLAGVVEAGQIEIVTPSNNQNLTAGITYAILAGNATYVNLSFWRSTDNSTFTNLTGRYNGTEIATGRAWNGTLAVADLSDGAYYLKVSGNNSEYNSTAVFVGFDDTAPTVSCSWLKRLQEGKLQTVTCTITDDGFTTALTGNATVITGDRFAGTKTMTGSAGSYTYKWSARSLGLREITVTAFDDHSQSTSNKFTYNVLEGSVAPEIATTTKEGLAIKTTQTQAKTALIAILGTLGFMLLVYLRMRRKRRKR